MVPEFVYQSHEAAFNHSQKSQTRIMSDFLLDYVEDNEYILEGEFVICDGYVIRVYIQQS